MILIIYSFIIGDSGGPLFCQSRTNPSEGYVAGIVSIGIGCALKGHPGEYVNIAEFLEWITLMEVSNLTETSIIPQQQCPGFKCRTGDGICRSIKTKCDRIVDCIGAEDEVDCDYSTFDTSYFICSKYEIPLIAKLENIHCILFFAA